MTGPRTLLEHLELYYDAVPRARSRVEEVGPFTLFVAQAGWPYYARPSLTADRPAGVDDVLQVLARQRELDVPQSLEWVDEVTPGLADVAAEARMTVERCPLLVLDGEPTGDCGTARMLAAEETELVHLTRAAVSVAFENPGIEAGAAGAEDRDTAAATRDPGSERVLHDRMAGGEFRFAAAFAPEAAELGPVGGGGCSPVADVAEITGVGVLPRFRRQGLGGRLTFVLAADALDRGVATVFCSAASSEAAKVYTEVGFRQVATACIASSIPGPT